MTDEEIFTTIANHLGYSLTEFRGLSLPSTVTKSGVSCAWNPILYNGDAMELAVEFRIHLEFDENCVIPSTDDWAFSSVWYNDSKMKATREAIYNTAKLMIEQGRP